MNAYGFWNFELPITDNVIINYWVGEQHQTAGIKQRNAQKTVHAAHFSVHFIIITQEIMDSRKIKVLIHQGCAKAIFKQETVV